MRFNPSEWAPEVAASAERCYRGMAHALSMPPGPRRAYRWRKHYDRVRELSVRPGAFLRVNAPVEYPEGRPWARWIASHKGWRSVINTHPLSLPFRPWRGLIRVPGVDGRCAQGAFSYWVGCGALVEVDNDRCDWAQALANLKPMHGFIVHSEADIASNWTKHTAPMWARVYMIKNPTELQEYDR